MPTVVLVKHIKQVDHGKKGIFLSMSTRGHTYFSRRARKAAPYGKESGLASTYWLKLS